MVVCDDFDFNKDMIGYDLRRNESVSKEYHRRFSPNMYSKVSILITRYNGMIHKYFNIPGSKESNKKT